MQLIDLTVHNLRYDKLCTLTDNSGYSAYDIVEKNSLNEITEFTFKFPIDENEKYTYLSNENLLKFNNEFYRIKTNNILHDEDGKRYSDITSRHLSETLQYTTITMAEQTPKTAIELMKVALCYEDDKPTLGWSIGNVTVDTEMKRGLESVEESSFSILTTIAEKFKGILHFNSMTRTVDLLKISTDYAPKFDLRVSKDLKNVSITYDTSDMITRLYCFGATDSDGNELNIMSVNPTGKAYVENYDYFKQLGYSDSDIKDKPELFTKTSIWRDTNYYEAQDLYDEGVRQVADISVPVVTVEIKALDLSQFGNYRTSSLSIGDVVKVIDEDIGCNFLCNITSISRDYKESHILDISVTNLIQYKDMLTKLFSDVSTAGTVITSGGKVIGSKVDGIKTEQISDLSVKYLNADFIRANYLTSKDIEANYVDAKKFETKSAEIDELKSNTAEFKEATIDKLKVHDEIVDTISGDLANFNSINILNLNATNANIDTLKSNVATIKTLINGNLSSENIQAGGITSDRLTIENGYITNAMILSLVADKITSGKINTSLVEVGSESGLLSIKDNTIQISDSSKVRVQIGKDASNDYSMYVWDANGNLMFDALGIHDSAIKSGIIRNDMVSGSANISGSKLDIASVVTSINGGTEKIQSSTIKMDVNNQTLDVAFSTLSNKVDDTTTTANAAKSISESNTTAIDVANGNINTLVQNTTITKDGITTQLKDAYTKTEQTVEGMSSTVNNHQTVIDENTGKITSVQSQTNALEQTVNGLSNTITNVESTVKTKADLTTVTSLSNNVASMSSDLTGFKSTVSSTYETKEVVSNIGDTANQAKTTADNASVLANSANSNSNSALLTANTAQSVANSVQERADGGEFDAVTIYLHSSAGTAFKNDQIATTLSVVIYHGGNTITDKTGLINEFGSDAYLEWSLRKFGDTSFTTIISTDSHFSNDGFSYTVGSEDINTQAVFNVQLIV